MAQSTPEVRAERLRLRAVRRNLSAAERRDALRSIARTLRRLRWLKPGARVAVYLAFQGEVDLAAVFPHARRVGARLYTPTVTSRRRREMRFVPFEPGSVTRNNVFGIVEALADAREHLPAMRLDLVLLPVVGFDRAGHRLGMGVGFYDRALRRRQDPARHWRRPRLVGVAFACQELPNIDPSPWDVAVDAVVTEREFIDCSPHRHPDRDSP